LQGNCRDISGLRRVRHGPIRARRLWRIWISRVGVQQRGGVHRVRAAACQWVAESDLASATVLGDSELVVDAFHGRKTLHLPALRHLMVVAKAWLAQAGPVCVEHVPRRNNERADALANTAVDQQSSNMLLRDPLDWVVPPLCLAGWAYFESDHPALPPRMAGARSVTKALAEIEVPSAADLMLPNSESFVAGSLHRFAPLWARICSKSAAGDGAGDSVGEGRR
jgi:hypothetical protein